MTLDVATHAEAETALRHVLADVDRGIWKPPTPAPVVEVQETPTLHVFASAWFADRRADGLKPRSLEALEWALGHVLEHLAAVPVNEITVDRVDAYRRAKLREREFGLVERPLSNASINRTIAVLAAVCDAAVEAGHLPSNPARGKRRRLQAAKPPRLMLEVDELRALLDGAGKHRALLAVMALAGLRVGEACALDWRDIDLARAQLHVRDAKTAAGVRRVDVSPDLLDTLKAWKADASNVAEDAPVFPTAAGTRRDRGNVRNRVLLPTIKRVNKQLAEKGLPTIGDGITNHALRRTFASLLYEAGASPAYVMSQMGHTSSALALEVYAKKMQRQRDTGQRMDALVRAADWAQTGTNGAESVGVLPVEETVGAAIPLR
jgi:integrase